ncbi:MAG: aminoglycoside phosphotransferase family protein [Chloroflexota bacterium]
MKNQFDSDTLSDLVQSIIKTNRSAIQLSPVQTGKHNASYWVTCDQGKFVMRIAPPDDAGFLFYEQRMMRQEPALHQVIREHTDLPVAEIVGYDFTRTIIDRDFIIMVALPGQPISAVQHLTQSQFNRAMSQVGEHLQHLHALTSTGCLGQTEYGYIGEHQPMEPQKDWAKAFYIMWHKLLDDVVACEAYTPDEAQAMRNLLDIHAEQLDRAVSPALLHMDVWSQNILIDDDGNVTGLVDFDRALWGDVEIEFAVLDYCGISVPAFWEGYGTSRDETPSALIRRQFYLLYEIQKYMPIEVWRRNDQAKALQYKQQCFEMAAELLPK